MGGFCFPGGEMCNFPITKLYIHKMIQEMEEMAQQAFDKFQSLLGLALFQAEEVSVERTGKRNKARLNSK